MPCLLLKISKSISVHSHVIRMENVFYRVWSPITFDVIRVYRILDHISWKEFNVYGVSNKAWLLKFCIQRRYSVIRLCHQVKYLNDDAWVAPQKIARCVLVIEYCFDAFNFCVVTLIDMLCVFCSLLCMAIFSGEYEHLQEECNNLKMELASTLEDIDMLWACMPIQLFHHFVFKGN